MLGVHAVDLPERKFDQGDVTVTKALIKETSVALDTV